MHSSSRIFFGAVGVVLVAALIGGCSQTPAQKADSDVSKAISDAQRLMVTAGEMLARPVVTVEKNAQGEVKSVVTSPNADAIKILARGERNLDAALRENKSQAQASLIADAHATRGQVLRLKAYYYGQVAAQARRGAGDMVDDIRQLAVGMAWKIVTMKSTGGQSALSAALARRLEKSARQNISDILLKIGEYDSELARLGARIEELIEQWRQLGAEHSAIKVEIRNSEEAQSRRLFEQQLAKQAQASEVKAEINQSEQRMEQLIGLKAQARRELNMWEQSKKSVESILASVADSTERDAAHLSRLAAELGRDQALVKDLTGSLNEACREAKEAEELAVKAYGRAVKQFSKAGGQIKDRKNKVQMSVEGAHAHMALGLLQARRHFFFQRINSLVVAMIKLQNELDEVGGGRLGGADFQAVLGYLDNPDELILEAGKHFSDAAAIFAKAGKRVDKKLRWVYLGLEARARIEQCRLMTDTQTPDYSDLYNMAKDALDMALDGRENSPHLVGVLAIRESFKELATPEAP